MDGLNKPHSRRKFLTTSGLAAVAASSMLGKHGQAAAAPASAPNPGLTATNVMELPPSAQISIRCLRSLTLLTMSAHLADPAFSAEVYEIGLKDLEINLQELIGLGTSDLVSYRPNPEESLPTRPWWWPKRRVRRYRGQLSHESIPEAGQLVLDIIRSLDGYAVAFYSQQLEFAELSQHLALVEMQTQFQRLVNAPSLAGLFPDDDDICPWWWPYPQPNWLHLHDRDWPVPPIPIPPCDLRELAVNLQRGLIQLAVAERYSDIEQGNYRRDNLRATIHDLANQMSAYAGTLTGWLEHDIVDRPPPDPNDPYPWPFHDGLIDELVDFADRPPPLPWRIKLGDQIMRASHLVGVACHIRERHLAGRLQDASLTQIKDLAYQI